jgi:murein DD-endopeptidase MepM/ murein hydrolase activator NlpD
MTRDRAYYEQLLTNSNVVAYLNAISNVEAQTYYTLNGNTIYVPTGPEHPNVIVPPGTSAAFGRYQFMPDTWSEIQAGLGSLDIRKPRDQDIAALYRMDTLRGTLNDVIAGNCIATLNSNAGEWAAIPKADSSFAYSGQGSKYDAAGFCKLVDSLKGTTLPKGPLVNDNVPTGTSSSNNPNNNTFTFGNTNFADITCPPIKEEDLYRANYQITNPGCKISSPVQPITGPSTNSGTVNNVRGTNKGVGFSVNTQGFGQCSSLRSPCNLSSGEVVFTSGYGWRWGKMHRGVDLAGPIGTPIYAASNGTIKYAGWIDGGYGNYIELLSPENILTVYAHLNDVKCSVGQQVTVGKQIGDMGSTGFSTGPHLHFEVDLGSGRIDPEDCIRFR